MKSMTEKKLRSIVRNYLIERKSITEVEEDKDLDISELEGLNLPPVLKKLLDPKVSPQRYASIDQMIDAGGNVKHQAFAIAAFALSYADMDEGTSIKMLNLAKGLVPKIVKAREKGDASE